jgi:hypothetical protein
MAVWSNDTRGRELQNETDVAIATDADEPAMRALDRAVIALSTLERCPGTEEIEIEIEIDFESGREEIDLERD